MIGRLVKDQDLWLVHQGQRESESLAHPGRIALYLAMGCIRQPDNVEHLVDPLALRSAYLERFGEYLEILRQGMREQAILLRVLQGKRITPQDIANAVRWLASDESRFLTGTVITVDAGWTAGG